MSQTLINAGILVLPAFADDLGAKTVTLKALTALWAETLGMAARDMEADRDLNEFGATALDSVRVAARLRDGFGVT
ncbi:MAG: acyl carrier protein, partial [Acidobacteriota bacterium]